MIRQCWLCGNCGENYPLEARGFVCVQCLHERTLYDADELGLDPETDNSPNAQSREA